MRSDRLSYYMYKYMPVCMGVLVYFILIFSYLYPERSTINGRPGPPDTIETIVMGFCGILLVLTPKLYSDHLVHVEMNSQRILILKDDARISVYWIDIEEVYMLKFISPTLYKLRVKNRDGYFLFTSSAFGLRFWGSDLSDMGYLIEKKKNELGI